MEGVWTPIGEGNGGTWIPLADIEETDDAWIIEAELPSVDRKDINVELRDNELVITGEIKEKERKGVLRRRTRRKGQFEYRVTLPGHPREEGIEANLHEGVLTVRCESSVWAHELEMLARELIDSLNCELGSETIVKLRCRTG